MRRFLFAAAAGLLPAVPAKAETEHDAAVWVNTTAMGKIAGDVVFFAEVQPRVGEDVSRLTQLILRPAIGVELSKAVTVYQGYARVIDSVEGGRDLVEDRSFQQVTWTLPDAGATQLQSRTRLEQRWRSDGPGMSLRLRQMVRVEHPLAPGERRVAALASVEGFVGLTTAAWGGTGGFDQVRTFVGVEIPLAGKSTIEAGYLNQLRDRAGPDIAMTHVASLTLFARF